MNFAATDEKMPQRAVEAPKKRDFAAGQLDRVSKRLLALFEEIKTHGGNGLSVEAVEIGEPETGFSWRVERTLYAIRFVAKALRVKLPDVGA